MRQANYADEIIERATTLRRRVDTYFRGALPRAVVQAELDDVRTEPWFALTFLNEELPEAVQTRKWYLEMDYEPLSVWRDVQQPTLFLYGEHDAWVPIEQSIRRYRAATMHIRDVTFQQIIGADHLMTHPAALEDAGSSGLVADAYLKVLQTWLAEQFGHNRDRQA